VKTLAIFCIQKSTIDQDLLYWEVVQIGHFPKKLKICVCDATQHAYAECQVTKHIYTLAMNLVTQKCQYLNGNNSVISASVLKFCTILEWDGLIVSLELSFISIFTS
jgi:hypothetical protein